jgi:excisionase family DNA binding protein
VATDTMISSCREIGGEPSLLIDAPAFAALLSVSPATLYRMLSAGKLPGPIRLSRGCVRWHRETVEHWLRASEAQGRLIDRATWETLCANTNGKPR